MCDEIIILCRLVNFTWVVRYIKFRICYDALTKNGIGLVFSLPDFDCSGVDKVKHFFHIFTIT